MQHAQQTTLSEGVISTVRISIYILVLKIKEFIVDFLGVHFLPQYVIVPVHAVHDLVVELV